VEVGVESCAVAVLDAMWRPWSSLSLEGAVVRRVPIPSEKYRRANLPKPFNVLVQDRDHLIAILYGQGSAWAEIILNIHDHQRGLLVDFYFQCFDRSFVEKAVEIKRCFEVFSSNPKLGSDFVN
jgi:hypothetical protein